MNPSVLKIITFVIIAIIVITILLVVLRNKKNGKYKKVQSNSIESDFISAAEVWAMNKVIRRWKIYGKWCVKLSNLYYKIKWKLKSEE